MASSPKPASASRTLRPEAVARRIEQAIHNGQLKPNERLPSERALAARWKVSRPLLREGVGMLVARGVLTRKHGLGTFINDPAEQGGVEVWADMARRHPGLQGDLLEFRHMLECRAAELAAERHDDADRERLQAAAAALDAAWCTDDRREQLRTDLAFHHQIAESAHNPVFSYLMNSLHKLLYEHMQLTHAGTTLRSQITESVRSQHQKLLHAILARDPAAARRAAGEHIDFVRIKLNHL